MIGLPDSYEGHPIRWGQWAAPGTALCGRTTTVTCEDCGSAGQTAAAGTSGGEQRASARRCPTCGLVVVHWRRDALPGETGQGKILRILEWRQGL